MFTLDPAFLSSSETLTDLRLSAARLQLDRRFPWIVLIPRRASARELDDLPPLDRALLMDEIVRAGLAVRAIGGALGRPVEKLNVGALGNITPQLHVHVVGRRKDDDAWPGPVWGAGQAQPYAPEALWRARTAAIGALNSASG